MTYGIWNDPCYPLCGSGTEQSPINLSATVTDPGGDLKIDYRLQALDVLNNGQTIKVLCTQQSAVIYADERYALQQFHFHHPAEHTIDQRTFAMELHLVHRNDQGQMLVLAVLIDGGGICHQGYDILWHHLPPLHDERCKFSNLQIDPAALLPADLGHFYRYEGSLTTPPCTEHIQWLILAETVRMSDEQLAAFHALYNGNNRPLQDRNGRIIYQHH